MKFKNAEKLAINYFSNSLKKEDIIQYCPDFNETVYDFNPDES